MDLVIREVKRYNIKVAVLQETKWFGNRVYQVRKSVHRWTGSTSGILAQTKRRGCGHAATAWKAGGSSGGHGAPEKSKNTLGGWSKNTIGLTSHLQQPSFKGQEVHTICPDCLIRSFTT